MEYFMFGSYYQENSSGKTPIEWLTLKMSDSMVFLISRYGLDCRQYHHENADMTWEKCDLGEWQNGEFLKDAFTPSEQEEIVLSKLANDSNARFRTIGGNSTEDRVFCLSLEAADCLFKDDAARMRADALCSRKRSLAIK